MLQRALRPARVVAVVVIGLAGPASPRNLQGSEIDTDLRVHLDARARQAVHDATGHGSTRKLRTTPFETLDRNAAAVTSDQQRYLSALESALGSFSDPDATRLVRVTDGFLARSVLHVELFDGAFAVASRYEFDLDTERARTWYGDVDGGGYALFVQHESYVHGIVVAAGETYKLSPLGGGLGAWQRVPAGSVNDCVVEADASGMRAPATENTSARSAARPGNAASRDEAGLHAERDPDDQIAREPIVIVDVLVAYESTVTDLLPDIVGHIEFLNAWANASYLNSRIHTAAGPCWPGERCVVPQLRIVAVMSLDCRGCEDPGVTNLLLNNRFALVDDGWFDHVHDVRDATGADVCVLMTTLDRESGNGTAKLGAPDPRWAFCLAETPYSVLHPYIYAHEIGHLQGAGHFSDAGDRPYARGFCHNPPGGDPANRFATIMCTQSTDRLPYFSNPELTWEPTPGNVFYMGDDDHNNARRMNETALIVASHRGRNVTPIDVTDFAVRGTAGGAELEWQLASATAKELLGVAVQRAAAREGPYETRTTEPLDPAANMSWTDTELAHGDSYWYRLQLIGLDGATSFVGPLEVHRAAWTTTLEPPLVRDGRVVIRYSLGPAPTRVELNVYDVRGRLVRVLERGVLGAGSFETRWDGRGDDGTTVARGIYVLRLTTANHASIRKLLMLRD